MNGGAGLRARRGMGANSRRLQVMGAIAFKLQQYSESASYQKESSSVGEGSDYKTDKALKGYTSMNEVLEPAGEEDVKRYKEWMETSRPLVKAEGMVLIGHPDDLACLQRRVDVKNSLGAAKNSTQESRKNTGHLHTTTAEV